jgi:hypothetical protein
MAILDVNTGPKLLGLPMKQLSLITVCMLRELLLLDRTTIRLGPFRCSLSLLTLYCWLVNLPKLGLDPPNALYANDVSER